MDDKSLRAYVTELVGTFALVFVSAGVVAVTGLSATEAEPGGASLWRLVSIALACGCVYAGALALALPLAGGYLNPAVTIMLWVFRRMDGAKALVPQIAATGIIGSDVHYHR